MSEKQTHSPEANPQQIIDFYLQAASYLDATIQNGQANVELGHGLGQLRVSSEIPELNGKHLILSYERPRLPEDPTQLDFDYPLIGEDETGKNLWQTPISVLVYDQSGSKIHDYHLEYAGKKEWTRAIDEAWLPGMEMDEYRDLKAIDAQEFIAQIEWGLENLAPHG